MLLNNIWIVWMFNQFDCQVIYVDTFIFNYNLYSKLVKQPSYKQIFLDLYDKNV